MTSNLYDLPGLRKSLESDLKSAPDLISVLERHHDLLKKAIKVLRDKTANAADKQESLSEFIHVLNMHARAEEETLYETLIEAEDKESRISGMASRDEHDIAYQLADELTDMDFEGLWSDEIDAKAKVLASLVQNHLQEEESVLFPLAQKIIDQDERSELSKEYLQKCRDYLTLELGNHAAPASKESRPHA